MAMVSVTLHPKIDFAGDNLPSMEQINHLHHLAHEECFISNSVKTNIQIVSS
jgi:organic hydroperoxide reductase OsmC/OhrA